MPNHIKLIEPEHIYINTETAEEYESVSKVIGQFKKGFDAEYTSKKLAYKDLVPNFASIMKNYKDGDYAAFEELHQHIYNEDLFNATANNYKFTWKKDADKGTRFHEKMEKADIDRGYAINPIDGKPYIVYTNEQIDPYNLKPGCYVEAALASPEHEVGGTADKTFLCPDPSYSFLYVDMFDYKTNKNILAPAYGKKKFFKPFNDLDETQVNGYTFQQSIYHYMWTLLGCTPRSSFLLLAPDYDETKMGTLKLDIWLEKSKQMLDLFLQKKSLEN